MTREQFEDMDFEEAIEWAYENLDCITDEEMLKEFAIEKIQNDDFTMGLHILNAIYNAPYNAVWYRYDYSMGTLETPTAIMDKEDIVYYNFFED